MSESREVFVSYHTSSAIDIVKKLVAALEEAGISCWYAPRDCEGDFAESIVRAIRGCRVFLFVLNHQSGHSEHCKNEVSQAFSRYSAHDGISFLPYMVESCQLSDGLSYYINRFHIMDGGIPSRTAGSGDMRSTGGSICPDCMLCRFHAAVHSEMSSPVGKCRQVIFLRNFFLASGPDLCYHKAIN